MAYLPVEIRGTIGQTKTSEEMSLVYERTYISVVLYSDEYTTPVVPTAGTIVCTASETGESYGSVPNGTIDVTTEIYSRPSFHGPTKYIKVTPSGIVGAQTYIVTIHKYSNGR